MNERKSQTWNSDNSVLDFLSKVSFSSLLHLSQNHGTDLLRRENLGLTILDLDLNVWLAILVHNLVRNKLPILLNLFVRESAMTKKQSKNLSNGQYQNKTNRNFQKGNALTFARSIS